MEVIALEDAVDINFCTTIQQPQGDLLLVIRPSYMSYLPHIMSLEIGSIFWHRSVLLPLPTNYAIVWRNNTIY